MPNLPWSREFCHRSTRCPTGAHSTADSSTLIPDFPNSGFNSAKPVNHHLCYRCNCALMTCMLMKIVIMMMLRHYNLVLILPSIAAINTVLHYYNYLIACPGLFTMIIVTNHFAIDYCSDERPLCPIFCVVLCNAVKFVNFRVSNNQCLLILGEY